MRFSQTACEILDMFRQTHRKPGARLTFAQLEPRLGADPAVAVAVSELAGAGYLIAPDAHSVELTATGFDAIELQRYRDAEP
jgi:hypothetical protein